MVSGIGPIELVSVLLVILVLFGAKRVPELARGMGSGLREFKQGLTAHDGDPQAARAKPPPARTSGEASDTGSAADGVQAAAAPNGARGELGQIARSTKSGHVGS